MTPKNGAPQEIVLVPLLFNICTYDLPVTVCRKFAYADDWAILHYASEWQALEETLTQDMAILSSNLYKYKLKLSTTRTVSVGFHLYKKAQHELKIFINGQALLFCAEATYLGIKLGTQVLPTVRVIA